MYLLDFTEACKSFIDLAVNIFWYILFSIPSLTSKYPSRLFLSLRIIDDKISKKFSSNTGLKSFLIFSLIISNVGLGTTFEIKSILLVSFKVFLIAVAEQIELFISSELYSEFILVIVYGLMLLFNFRRLFIYSIPKMLLDELSMLKRDSLDILI